MVDSLKFKDLKLDQLNTLQEVKSAEECKTLLTEYLKISLESKINDINIININNCYMAFDIIR